MIEDDAYRSSSQFRYWSYTEDTLARIRQKTNDLASERVRAAFRRAQASKASTPAQNGDQPANGSVQESGSADAVGDTDIQTLTVDEELKIVEWGCQKIMDMGEAISPRVPSAVVVRPMPAS